MKDVEIIQAMGSAEAGIFALCYMRVCANRKASDEEVLGVCNRENSPGTSGGWSSVVREKSDKWAGPVTCSDHADRQHIIVLC